VSNNITITALRSAIESVIAKISPTGGARGRNKFRRASTSLSNHDWNERASADVDREFRVTSVRRGEILSFGSTTSNTYKGTFSIEIGHNKTGNVEAGWLRMDQDLHLIAATLEKSSNLPDGVHQIRLVEYGDPEDILEGKYWLSTLGFEIIYSMAAP